MKISIGFVLFLCTGSFGGVDGHGYVTEPPARNAWVFLTKNEIRHTVTCPWRASLTIFLIPITRFHFWRPYIYKDGVDRNVNLMGRVAIICRRVRRPSEKIPVVDINLCQFWHMVLVVGGLWVKSLHSLPMFVDSIVKHGRVGRLPGIWSALTGRRRM